MFHKLKSVSTLPDYRLLLSFSEGVSKTYALTSLFERYPVFRAFQETPSLFAQAQVEAGGYAVIWNDDLDLACEELWKNGTTISTPFDQLLAFSDATSIWGLNESTLRKAVSYGKLKDGIDVQKFGKQWVVTTDAMCREYGDPHQT